MKEYEKKPAVKKEGVLSVVVGNKCHARVTYLEAEAGFTTLNVQGKCLILSSTLELSLMR